MGAAPHPWLQLTQCRRPQQGLGPAGAEPTKVAVNAGAVVPEGGRGSEGKKYIHQHNAKTEKVACGCNRKKASKRSRIGMASCLGGTANICRTTYRAAVHAGEADG